jgi:hypothetical protein
METSAFNATLTRWQAIAWGWQNHCLGRRALPRQLWRLSMTTGLGSALFDKIMDDRIIFLGGQALPRQL